MRLIHLPTLFITITSLICLVFMILRVSPYHENILRGSVVGAFMLLAMLASGGVVVLIGYAVRSFRSPVLHPKFVLKISLRQAAIVGLAVGVLMGTAITMTLNPITLGLTIISAIALEFIFA